MRPISVLFVVLVVVACAAPEKEPAPISAVDVACLSSRVLSYQDLAAEVLIPAGETCGSGSFQVVFTRGDAMMATKAPPYQVTAAGDVILDFALNFPLIDPPTIPCT